MLPRTRLRPRTEAVLRAARLIVASLSIGLIISGCGGSSSGMFGVTANRGYVFDQAALDQVPAGSSQEQVLLVLGTPSTVATVAGEVFYYISQKTYQPAAFMNPEVTEQRVIAVYFNEERRVFRIANYGLKDGKIFDFISRTTPTSGEELNLLRQMFKGLGGMFQGIGG
jgi:outer membrane protein assembly factor BamE (lipoprotein component of BamABCDE complex)